MEQLNKKKYPWLSQTNNGCTLGGVTHSFCGLRLNRKSGSGWSQWKELTAKKNSIIHPQTTTARMMHQVWSLAPLFVFWSEAVKRRLFVTSFRLKWKRNIERICKTKWSYLVVQSGWEKRGGFRRRTSFQRHASFGPIPPGHVSYRGIDWGHSLRKSTHGHLNFHGHRLHFWQKRRRSIRYVGPFLFWSPRQIHTQYSVCIIDDRILGGHTS